MATKRYFFVHLAIFVAVSSTFVVAGITTYQDFLQAEHARIAGDEKSSTVPPVSRTAPVLRNPGVLALSSPLASANRK